MRHSIWTPIWIGWASIIRTEYCWAQQGWIWRLLKFVLCLSTSQNLLFWSSKVGACTPGIMYNNPFGCGKTIELVKTVLRVFSVIHLSNLSQPVGQVQRREQFPYALITSYLSCLHPSSWEVLTNIRRGTLSQTGPRQRINADLHFCSDSIVHCMQTFPV